ncbi:MAG TPA: hypothetical protein VFH58_13690 [Acidimicrobiales bacterium]|nr:hypothetical protein [Acidimicrobiales bacterium]
MAILVTACGGSSKASSAHTTTTTTAGNAAFAASRAKFVSCLEAHGVPASEATRPFGFRRGADASPGASASSVSPPPSTPPTTDAIFGAAFATCRSDLPTGPGRGGDFTNTAAGRAYLQCLQLHGVSVPSTTVPGQGFRSFATDPNFQKARVACAALAPTRPGGGASSTTSLPGGV